MLLLTFVSVSFVCRFSLCVMVTFHIIVPEGAASDFQREEFAHGTLCQKFGSPRAAQIIYETI